MEEVGLSYQGTDITNFWPQRFPQYNQSIIGNIKSISNFKLATISELNELSKCRDDRGHKIGTLIYGTLEELIKKYYTKDLNTLLHYLKPYTSSDNLSNIIFIPYTDVEKYFKKWIPNSREKEGIITDRYLITYYAFNNKTGQNDYKKKIYFHNADIVNYTSQNLIGKRC